MHKVSFFNGKKCPAGLQIIKWEVTNETLSTDITLEITFLLISVYFILKGLEK